MTICAIASVKLIDNRNDISDISSCRFCYLGVCVAQNYAPRICHLGRFVKKNIAFYHNDKRIARTLTYIRSAAR